MPFYVSPEQAMKDKADYARKGIARGRNSVVIQYDEGILFVAPNPSGALHKISEIYDRIAFAAVGRYNEYENLRVAGVRYADTRGYQYDRADVTARRLANGYARILGTIFTESNKPYEVVTHRDQGQSAGGRRAHARPGAPGFPAAHRPPTRGAAARGQMSSSTSALTCEIASGRSPPSRTSLSMTTSATVPQRGSASDHRGAGS